MKQYDVTIIGARIAGSATAIRLARAGLKVLLVDKMNETHDVLSTHFMNARGLTYLHSLGIAEAVLKETPAFHHFEVSVDEIALGGSLSENDLQRRFETVHPNEIFKLDPRYTCIRRAFLDKLLQEEAVKSGAELRLGTPFTEELLEGTEICVGADGKNSTVAEHFQVSKMEERHHCTFACYSYFKGLELPHALLKKRNRLSFAAVPTNDGNTMVLVFGPDSFYEDFKREKEFHFFKALQIIDPEFHRKMVSSACRVEPFRLTVDQQPFIRKSSPQAPLIGDAHCFKDQCTANGMTHALRDAFLLSEELQNFFGGKKLKGEAIRDFEDRRSVDLFRFYEFTTQQAEMNPLRPDEKRLYRAISNSSEERNRFIGLYFDVVPVREFFEARRLERLIDTTPLEPIGISSSVYQNPFSTEPPDLALEQNCFDYSQHFGPDLFERTQPYYDFYQRREQKGMFQYSRTLHRIAANTTLLSDNSGRKIEGINFASQDYLGLGQDPEIAQAAIESISKFGPHSAGSPMIIGNTLLTHELEEELKILTGKKYVLLFATGYAAGFGSIIGIVKPQDHIVMDRLTHACLQQGARAATRKVHRYAHLDPDAARAMLRAIRKRDTKNAILLITEGLFSMDADSPDLKKFQEIAHQYNAFLFVDVAHDLGATGPEGRGQMGVQGMYGKIDIVMGSFSKSFATNGGFVATDSKALIHYLKMFSSAHLFSNALSPIQTAIALKACQIIRSPKGALLREKLHAAVTVLRSELMKEGQLCFGAPGPIVPVFIGSERKARLCHRAMTEAQLAAMIIEYPVVPLGASRFRLQVMATHTPEQAKQAAQIIGNGVRSILKKAPPKSASHYPIAHGSRLDLPAFQPTAEVALHSS